MAKTIIKPAGKRLIAFVCIVAAVFGLYFASQHMQKSGGNENGKTEKSFLSKMFGGGNERDYITIGTNTYAGFLYLSYLNNGLEPNEDCLKALEIFREGWEPRPLYFGRNYYHSFATDLCQVGNHCFSSK